MIPNIHQSIDEIIKDSPPERKVIWQQVRLITGENAGIQQYYYCAEIANSEFIINDAHVLWLGYEIEFSGLGAANATFAFVRFFHPAAINNFIASKNSIYYDPVAAAARYSALNCNSFDIIFNYIDSQLYTHVRFTGYKIRY